MNDQTTTAPAAGIFASPNTTAVDPATTTTANPAPFVEPEKAEEAEPEEQAPPVVTELDMLKARAKMMGIVHSPNIGVEALKQKIGEKLGTAEPMADTNQQVNALEAMNQPAANKAEEMVVASVQGEAEQVIPVRKRSLRQKMKEEQMKLIRVRIANMDPKKAQLSGEIITVANEYLGTVRKFIPFGEATENGYHVPYCLFKELKERRFLSISTKKDQRTGVMQPNNRWVPEFSLEVLPPLTEKELAQLATAQIAAGTATFGDDDSAV